MAKVLSSSFVFRRGGKMMNTLLKNHFSFDSMRGTFSLAPLLQNATASVIYRDARGQHTLSLAGNRVAPNIENDHATLTCNDATIDLTWHALIGEATTAWIEIVNRGRTPIQIDEMRVLSLDAANGARVNLSSSPAHWRFFQNGWQSWSAAFVRDCGNGIHIDPATDEYRLKHQPHAIPATPKTFASEWFTVLTEDGRSRTEKGVGHSSSVVGLLLGFVTAAHQLSEIRLQLAAEEFLRLEAIAYCDGVRVDPGDTFTSEKLRVAFGDGLTLLDDYAKSLGENMRARIPAQPLTGWCTWYYFFGENTERDVLANLERLRAERLPLGIIVIDDGYQTSDGDWTSVDAEKFPRGLKWLAAEIRHAGFVPGLWVAPFAVNENSQLAREHPEFLLRAENGEPVTAWIHWGQKCFSLDLSRADVQAWLRETFRTLSDDWGYGFFKLDFLYTAAQPGNRHDPKMTRAQAVRRGLEIIRETVGEKIILGCGAPLAPSIGIVDAMRIGPDVAITWEPIFKNDLTDPATAYAMRNTMLRAFMHNRLWHNDPDCVLVRRRDDENDLKLNEMRTMVSLIGLAGGAVLSSDNLGSIRRGRLKYLKQILPPTNLAARPRDLFENELPQIFALPIETAWGKWSVVGIVNWRAHTTTTEIDLEKLGLDPTREYHVYNYWHRRYAGVVRASMRIKRHQPHETRVLLFKPVSAQTELLTTTFHLAQGLCEVKAVTRREELRAGKRRTQHSIEILRVELEKPGYQTGDVIFVVPKSRKVIVTRVDGKISPHRLIEKGIVAVGLTLDEKAVVEIETT